jgi:hypothetical protein
MASSRLFSASTADPIPPAVGNFLLVDVGEDAEALNETLLRRASSSG